MAEKISVWPFGSDRSKYPWHEWFDGNIWKLERGLDFEPEAKTLRSMAYGKAKRDGVKLRTLIDGDFIYLQAIGSAQVEEATE